MTGLPPVPGQPVRCQIVKPDGTTIDFEATHTFSDDQVEWFRAGSALNIVRSKVSGEACCRRIRVASCATCSVRTETVRTVSRCPGGASDSASGLPSLPL